jgi:hypothetical protein
MGEVQGAGRDQREGGVEMTEACKQIKAHLHHVVLAVSAWGAATSGAAEGVRGTPGAVCGARASQLPGTGRMCCFVAQWVAANARVVIM